MKFLLIVIYLIMTVAGLVLMKYGKNPGSIKVGSGEIAFSCSFDKFCPFYKDCYYV